MMTVTSRLPLGEYTRRISPYLLLLILTSPIFLGYLWIIIATFSDRTSGLLPVGGLTLDNWEFLRAPAIWRLTANTFVLAAGLAIVVVLISALTGYALSRISFAGRRGFLGLTLILHAFPSVTLLIAIFFVLRWLLSVPLIGPYIGYNSLGGVILVKVALELPLGVWLMKGFFDNVSWDVERAALIDGAGRFRVWWEIVLPLIRPGIAALAIFSFISGWNEFLIVYTFITAPTGGTIAVYLNSLLGATAPVDYSTVAAVGLFQLMPILIFFLFTQEYLLNIFAGGTKGGS